MQTNFVELLPLAVLLPFFGAGLAFAFFRQRTTQRAITIGVVYAATRIR